MPCDTDEHAKFKEKLRNGIELYLKDKYSNCMIVGSPDVSDYAEVILAKLYNIEPFNNTQEISAGDKRFVFYKNNLTDEVHSSFYRNVEKEEDSKVYFFGETLPITEKHTYGVITIAQNPFCVSGKIDKVGKVLVLSGYTGIATFGLLRLLIDVQSDYTDQMPANLFTTKLLERLVPKYKADSPEPFSAIVTFVLKDITEEMRNNENLGGNVMAGISDNRRIEDIWVSSPKI